MIRNRNLVNGIDALSVIIIQVMSGLQFLFPSVNKWFHPCGTIKTEIGWKIAWCWCYVFISSEINWFESKMDSFWVVLTRSSDLNGIPLLTLRSHMRGEPGSSSALSITEYAVPAMVHFLNSMMFLVSVPVLSEKMYLICPSSSFRLDVLALAIQ